MSNKHADFLDNGTKQIEEFCVSNKVSNAEREFIINEFTNELVNNVGNTDNLRDYDLIIHTASARFLDEKINQLLAKRKKDSDDRRSIISYCERLENVLSVFRDKKWSLPQIKNSNPLHVKKEQEDEESRIQAEKERKEREAREKAEREERERQEKKRLEELRIREKARKEEEMRQREIQRIRIKRRIIVYSSLAAIVVIGILILSLVLSNNSQKDLISSTSTQTAASLTSTPSATVSPTATPTATPTAKPTATPTPKPTATPTTKPTATPTAKPTAAPTKDPDAPPSGIGPWFGWLFTKWLPRAIVDVLKFIVVEILWKFLIVTVIWNFLIKTVIWGILQFLWGLIVSLWKAIFG